MNQWLKFTEKYNNKFIGHYVYLNPPADEKAIQTLEEIIGTTLPQAFRDIYLVNNGQSLSSEDGCIFGLELMPIESIIKFCAVFFKAPAHISEFVALYSSTPPNAIKHTDVFANLVPIINDAGGNYIGIDFDPDTQGTVGQIINFGRDEMRQYVAAKSLQDFLVLLIDLVDHPAIKVDVGILDILAVHINDLHFTDALRNILYPECAV